MKPKRKRIQASLDVSRAVPQSAAERFKKMLARAGIDVVISTGKGKKG